MIINDHYIFMMENSKTVKKNDLNVDIETEPIPASDVGDL